MGTFYLFTTEITGAARKCHSPKGKSHHFNMIKLADRKWLEIFAPIFPVLVRHLSEAALEASADESKSCLKNPLRSFIEAKKMVASISDEVKATYGSTSPTDPLPTVALSTFPLLATAQNTCTDTSVSSSPCRVVFLAAAPCNLSTGLGGTPKQT